ncbi:hypothetical protein BESB_024280 [Besnoitia besnoiti]|uniref:Transmembrane protein n=1 Tax=Besnoitia besnoiti TaxID=94643 RepID=A0A2A9M7R1_BESBE|nr:hypothetical protein BESB_024280 [Besnoitia besnoiti]PFH31936.1 hypothetical protein BESB_024280 [Besnoitia besnoiti]
MTKQEIRGPAAKAKEDDDEPEPFCTGQCTAECLIVFFVYALVVFGCTLLTTFGMWSMTVTATVPAGVLFSFFLYIFGRKVSPQQLAYVALSTLALALPLSMALPVVRSAWTMAIRLLDFASFRPNKPWFVRPGYPLWSFVDTFVLEAMLQELVKAAVIYKVFTRKLVQRPGDFVAYSVVASSVVAVVDVGMQALKVASSLRSMPKFVMVSGNAGSGQAPHGLPDHQAGVLWSFTLYYAGFIIPMQMATGIILASMMACRELLHQKLSFIKVISWPILLHGTPIFASQILRHISHNEAFRVLHGADPASLSTQELSRLGAFTALLQFIVCIVMAMGISAAFTLSRFLYLKVARMLPPHSLPTSSAQEKAGFLFTWNDVFQRDDCSP